MSDLDVLPVPTTWAGHRRYASRALLRPRTTQALREVVTGEDRVRVLGSRHSFTDLVDSPGALLTLEHLEREPELHGDVVRVSGATRYGTLGPWLHERGRALAALASLPHISVAGAVATGTHGSGDAIGSLATAVVGLEIMTADGEIRALGADDPDLPGAVVSLGALGVVLSLDLATQPTYDVAQTVIDDVPMAAVLADLDRVWSSATSVSAFTRWDGTAALWRKHRTDAPTRATDLSGLGGTPATSGRHPIPDTDPAACTPQLGMPGPWHTRLPHFRLEHTPSAGAELQSEYLLPREHAARAIAAVAPLMARSRDLVLVSEIRSIAADDLWLSGAFGRATIGLHTTWRQEEAAVREVLAEVERALAPFDARPHWGKVLVDHDVAARYPRWEGARDLVHRYDPTGRFSGPCLERIGLRG